MPRTLLLNVAEPEERRAALLEDGRLSLLWVERSDERTLVGNVYKGRVTRVETAIGAAFVDVGLARPGFLHEDDVLAFPPQDDAGDGGVGGETVRTTIDQTLSRGDDIVVQVARDPLGHKGATLTARVSYPGRTVVLLPGLGRAAVSRKITDEATRDRLRDLLAGVEAPEGCGVVARTAAQRASDEEILAEARELVARHEAVAAAAATCRAPALLHGETAFAGRAVRELLVRSPEGADGPLTVVADTDEAVDDVRAALAAATRPVEIVRHASGLPLFHAHGIEEEVRRLASPNVPLSGGASLAIHETEALWAIDVNSGRRRRGVNLEATALETDLIAAAEIARQIRLRDVAGLIVIDFIDCRDPDARREVEAVFRAALAKDPARMRVAPISEFMVVEITRRRTRTGPGRAGSQRCPCCHGSGRVRTAASAALAAVRDTRALASEGAPRRIEIVCAPEVADALEERERALETIESSHGVAVDIVEDESLGHAGFRVAPA